MTAAAAAADARDRLIVGLDVASRKEAEWIVEALGDAIVPAWLAAALLIDAGG